MYKLADIKQFLKTISVYHVLTRDNVRQQLEDIYYYVFDYPLKCSGCANEIENAIHKLMIFINKHDDTEIMLQKNTKLMKYTMKDNVRIYSNSMRMMVTKYNCTDAVAEALIAENEKHLAAFIINDTGDTENVKPKQKRGKRKKAA